MATVAERARELATKMRRECYTSENWIMKRRSSLDLAKAITHFEQALLAERRLAMEEAANIVLNQIFGINPARKREISEALRAAAEKEVPKPRKSVYLDLDEYQ